MYQFYATYISFFKCSPLFSIILFFNIFSQVLSPKSNLFTSEIDPPFVAHDTLKAWQKKNHPWLELSDVHIETTENVRITVIPFYMGSRDNQSTPVYWVSLK